MNDVGTADGLQPSQQASDLSGAFLASSFVVSAWIRSPRKTACMILRTSRSFWLTEIRSWENMLA